MTFLHVSHLWDSTLAVVLLLLLVVPGLFAWASGIKFVKMDRGGDFAFRYFHHQQRIGLVFWLGLAVVL